MSIFEPLLDRKGNCYNGCLYANDESIAAQSALEEKAISINSLGTGTVDADMPVIKYDNDFKTALQGRAELIAAYWENGGSTLPWHVEAVLSQDRQKKSENYQGKSRLYWSQQSVPSCAGHGNTFAGHSSILSSIALGDNRIYCPHNPVVTWAVSKNGSFNGGQTITRMAEYANRIGNFPEYLVGDNNLKLPSKYKDCSDEALKHQWAISFLPDLKPANLANDIIDCCKAGLGVAFANSTAVISAVMDVNGVKVAKIQGSWFHMTSFCAYRKIYGTEYIFWVNSHGKIYGSSPEGEPADGAWMTRKQVEIMCQTAHLYGNPYCVIPEGLWVADTSLISKFFVKRPATFKYILST